MKERKLRVGIIGAGGIARSQHIPHWQKIPGVEVVGIVDTHEDARRDVCAQFKISNAYIDHRDLLKLGVDIVDICSPNMFHTPATMDALSAGVHVLCEKPLAVTTKEVAAMGKLADKKKLKLMTAQFQRFTQAAVTIKEWSDAGNIGHVYHSRVRATRRAWLPSRAGFIDKKLSGGGPCMDIGVHALDTCLWVMGFPKPVRVTGTSKVNFAKGHKIPGMWGEWDRKNYTVEDFAVGFVHFEDGSTMILESSWLGHQLEDEDLSFQLFGQDAGVKWPSCEYASVQGKTFVQGTLRRAGWIQSAYEAEIRAFHDCVVNNKPSPVPWTETIRVIGILEAIYESEEKGREVAVRS